MSSDNGAIGEYLTSTCPLHSKNKQTYISYPAAVVVQIVLDCLSAKHSTEKVKGQFLEPWQLNWEQLLSVIHMSITESHDVSLQL